MRITFEEITIENFGSFYSGPHNFSFGDRPFGLHFVWGHNEAEPRLGSNGSGKSTLFNALCWCLYGRTVEGLRNTDIKPWGGKSKKTFVGVLIKIGDDKVTIIRTANPNGLFVDTKEVAQDYVDALLRMDLDIFLHTVLRGQSLPLFFDLEPREKMQLISNVLRLERWEKRAAKASARVAEFEQSLAQLKGEEIGLTESLKQAVSMQDVVKLRQKEWAGEQRRRVEALQNNINYNTTKLEGAEEERDKADLAYEKASVDLKLLLPDIEKLREEISKLEKLDAARAASRHSLDRQIKALQEERDNFGKDGKCPICRQPLKGTNVDKHLKELDKKVADLTAERNTHTKPVDSTKERAQLDEYRKQERAQTTAGNEAHTTLHVLNTNITRLKTTIAHDTEEITRVEQEENPYQEQASTLRKHTEKIKADLSDLKDAIEHDTEMLERVKFWVKGFKDVILYIIEELMDELQMATNAALEEVGLVGWEVIYAMEKETKAGTTHRGFDILIKSPSNSERVRWKSWSGGESQRLRLVGAEALSEVLLNHAGLQVSLEVFDEPTRGLSGEGLLDLIDFLADRARQLEQHIFLIDHHAIESNKFASVTKIEKTKTGSHIVAEVSYS